VICYLVPALELRFQSNGISGKLLIMCKGGEWPMVQNSKQLDRRNKSNDRQLSFYGLTPKVETAIIDAVRKGAAQRARTLIAPLHPADQADLLERMPAGIAASLIRFLNDHLNGQTLTYLKENTRGQIVEVIGAKALARQLHNLSTDDAIDIVEELEKDTLADVLAALSNEKRVLIEESLSFPEDSAGRLMQREIITVPSFWTVGQTIDFLRSGEIKTADFYLIFVVDPARKALGEVPLSKLLCSQRHCRILEIMEDDFRLIPVNMDQEEVAVLFRRYGMVSAGVVDLRNRLVGMITIDDVIDVIDEEAEEDLMALAGVGGTSLRSSITETMKGRTAWLLVNLVTAILASVVIGLFEGTIEQLVALAVLMPIVASMGGNAGTQTIAVAVRAIALRQLDSVSTRSFIFREFLVALLNGLVFASLAGFVSFVWFSDPEIAVIMAVAMLANLLVAGLSGTLVPVGLLRSGVDPAVASSVFVTTITDVVGFSVFLGLAALYLM
jgi:magnesium transporter